MVRRHYSANVRLTAAGLLAGLLLAVGSFLSTAAHSAELVMFEASYCEWCAAWHEEIGPIYPKTAEARVAPLRQVDIDDPRPDDLSHIDGIVYTPTFVLIENGNEIGRINGYPGEDHFWGLLGVLLERIEARSIN